MKFYLALAGLAAVVYILYLHNPSLEDYNWESMDIPLTVGYLTSGKDHSQVLENYKQQDGVAAHGYPRGRFRFDHFSLACPVQCVSYIPFIKLFGVSNKAIAWYAMFYCVIAWALTAYIAYLLFGKWEALLSVFFLATSLSWLIHTKAAVISVMPSVCLFLGLVIAVIKYRRCYCVGNNGMCYVCLMGALLSLTFLTGWIVFPFSCLFLALNWKELIGNYRSVIISFVISVALFIELYSILYTFNATNVILAVWDGYTYRFFQGQNPSYSPALWEKPLIAAKQLFWDMKALDHPDKYMEGCASINWIFTGFFLYGLFINGQKVLLYWLISVFLILVTVYAYANRYAMIVLPAMAIIASWGLKSLLKKVWAEGIPYNELKWKTSDWVFLFVPFLLLIPAFTWVDYNNFIHNSPADFERDRMRGHTALNDWLKANHKQEDTLLILGDPINISPFTIMFHNFEEPYPFLVYTRFFNNHSTPTDIVKLEDYIFKIGYKKIVYVFSTHSFVDFSPFLRAHIGVEPSFRKRYNNRHPELMAFTITQ